MTEDSVWLKSHVALNDYFKILTCKKCQKHMRNPKQFLNCGHYACGKCIGTETDCILCGIPGEKHEIHNDSTINDLLENLNVIAEAIKLNVKETKLNHELDEFPSNLNFSNINIRKPVVTKAKTSDNISNDASACESLVNKKPFSKTIKANDDISNISVCESSISRSTSQGNNNIKIPKKINKKNTKGETALHIACRKNHLDRAKILLESGADPNTKDNAGWTPLQEAASSQYYEICDLLLNAKANPNMYGLDNRTALHEAVKNDDVSLASLLLRFNANKKVFDNVGKKPRDYCKSKAMVDLLASSQTSPENDSINKTVNSEKSISIFDPKTKIVLFGSNLKSKNRKLLVEFGTKKKIKIETHFSPAVTHVLIETNNEKQIKLSFDVLLSILQGKYFISSDCLPILMENENIYSKDLDIFEVNPPQLEDGPIRARENKLNQHPQLFNNCYFYFCMKNFDTIEYDDMTLTKDQLMKLVEVGDGIVLSREPKPDDIQGSLSPFHVAHDNNHSLHKCTHYVIYNPEDSSSNNNSSLNRVVYNLPFLKTLPLMWFIESVLRFKLIDPIHIGL